MVQNPKNYLIILKDSISKFLILFLDHLIN